MSFARWFGPFLTLVWASAGVYLAWPMTVSAILELAAVPLFFDIQKQVLPTPAALAVGIDSLNRARAWRTTGALYADAGFLELLRSQDPSLTVEERDDLLNDTRADFEAGLALSPVQPQTWIRLAIVRDMQGRPAEEVIEALMASFVVASSAQSLAPSRIGLLLDYWWSLTPGQRVLAAKEITRAWATDRRAVLRAATDPRKAPIIEYALSTVPGAAGDLRRYLSRRGL